MIIVFLGSVETYDYFLFLDINFSFKITISCSIYFKYHYC